MAKHVDTISAIAVLVRTGHGTIKQDGTFSDTLGTTYRVPRQMKGWQSITYEGLRYRLGGGIHAPYFICLNNPIRH